MRKSKVIGFSIPPAIYQKLDSAIKTRHKTKSEFFREMIDVYFKLARSVSPIKDRFDLEEADLAKILRTYWELRSKRELEIIIIGLGIIIDGGRVLIGVRKEKDPWVENLTWAFPGGRMNSLDFENELKSNIKSKTGLKVLVDSLVTARISPDSGFKQVQIVALYFACRLAQKGKPKPKGDFVKLKWVQPTDVFKYFTTSTCDEVTKFLATIQKSS